MLEAYGDAAGLLRELIGTAQEPFLGLDDALRIVGASEAFASVFGFAPDRLEGGTLGGAECFGARAAPLVALVEEARSSELLAGRPVALPVAAGGVRSFVANVRPLREGLGQVAGFLLSLHVDEADSGEPDPLPRLAAAHVGDVVALYRPDGTCAFAGGGCEAVLGYAPREFVELSACDHLHPVDRPACRSAFDRVVSCAEVRRFPVRARTSTGEFLWMDVVLRRVEHPELGALVHLSARDTTRERRAEESLRWLARQTRLILDSAGEGIFGLDGSGVVTFANPAAARLLHRPVPDLLGHSYRQFAPEAVEIQSTLADGLDRVTAERVFTTRGGVPLPVEFTCTAARVNGSVAGAVVTFRDDSERRRSQEALQRTRWLDGIEQTVLALRHEINNPLTALLAEVSLLQMGGNSAAEEREMVGSIAEQARRIRDVVRRLTEVQEQPTLRTDSHRPMLDLSA